MMVMLMMLEKVILKAYVMVMVVLDVGRNDLHVAFVIVVAQVIGDQGTAVGQFRYQFRLGGAGFRFWRGQQFYRGLAIARTVRYLDDGDVGGRFAR